MSDKQTLQRLKQYHSDQIRALYEEAYVALSNVASTAAKVNYHA